ncbi:capsid protein precursor [Mamastrovirus 17]|uniref:Capsid protein n=1 Tax=Bat astrovirus Hp/Guangxi/LC03/2007 TaxID=627538 RepID=C0KCU8_9VIRU|nr:capsid protein precursor [Bat astrovirus Hp/Guangxi/LC03/2007]ACN88720.1 capsid protein precursor [Bat astrovirus Hp/Guangxi/LC03/2007]
MAEAPKPQRQRRRRRKVSETKVDVKVTETDKVEAMLKPKRRRRRNRRPVFGPWLPGQGPRNRRRSRLRRAIKKEIKREGLDGPRVSVQQRVSSTFGLVGPNQSGNVELELNFFLHPALAKEANDGTSFGPVQALAAQYALWKLKFLKLIFTPMVGASAVSGTVVRASLNLSQSPGGTNWSGLGTRIHLDIHPGQQTTFFLRGDQIGGPRDGGWWLTDTNEEGSQSAGPIVEVHTLGKTSSTFTNTDWTGPLFIVEGIGLWQFANYQVKPALGMLERRQAETKVSLSATPGEPITMSMPVTSDVAVFMMNAEPEVVALPSTSTVGETIFQVVDVGAKIAEVFIPPPFNWLIAGGWWFLKRAFGVATFNEDGTQLVKFNVYPSLADAQNNRPAIAGATAAYKNQEVTTNLIVTQMNSPNVGPQPTPSAFVRASVPVPMPTGTFRMHTEMFPEEAVSWSGSGVFYPNSYIIGDFYPSSIVTGKNYLKTAWYVTKDVGPNVAVAEPSKNGSFIHTLYVLKNARFSTLDGSTEYYPPSGQTGAALYFGSSAEAGATNYQRFGTVVATAHVLADSTSKSAFLGLVLTLIKADTYKVARNEARDRKVIWAAQAGSDPGKIDKITFANIVKSGSTTTQVTTVGFSSGDYLLGVSYAVGGSQFKPGGIDQIPGTQVDVSVHFPFNQGAGTAYVTDAFFRIDGMNALSTDVRVIPYYLSGNIFAASSADLNMNFVSGPSAHDELLEALKRLGVAFQPDFHDIDVEETPEYLKDFLTLLADEGRLPNRAELAMRAGDYQKALKIYRDENSC